MVDELTAGAENPYEHFSAAIEGDLQEENEDGVLKFEDSSMTNDRLICFKWSRVIAGAHRGLYVENICTGSRAVTVEWRRNGKLIETSTYRLTGRTKRKVRERTKDGRLVSETAQFSCRPGAYDNLCLTGKDVAGEIRVSYLTEDGFTSMRMQNRTNRYAFATFAGKRRHPLKPSELVDYWGTVLLPPVRRIGVTGFFPEYGETGYLAQAREEPL